MAEAVYDSSANTYTIHVAPSKAKYTLVGYFKGKIIIGNANALTAYKGCQLTFNQAYLVAPEGDAISYGNDDGNVEIVAKKDTVNYIVAEDGNAVTSSHNVEFDGKGTLNIIASNHGVKGDDIKVYEAPIINVSGCGKDPFHGHNFLTDNDGADSYAGTLTISGGEQAFEMQNGSGTESDPYSDGAITINAGAVIKVDSVKNVFFAYSTVSISGAVTATNVSYGAVVPVVTGLLSLTVTEPGFFTSNGSAISSGTY